MSPQQVKPQQQVSAISFHLNQQHQQPEEQQNPRKNPVPNFPEVHKSRKSCWNLQSQFLEKLCIFCGELIATAMLMFLGCMGCVETGIIGNSHFQCALNFGFVVLICIQCFGCISGAHLNPVVSLAAYIYNTLTLPMLLMYFVAQMLGAFIGYGLLKAVLPPEAMCGPEAPAGNCVTALSEGISPLQGVFIEFLITIALTCICCGVWDPRNAKFQDSTPVRFALAIACLSLTAGQLTGASMNPARSFAPALWNGSWENQWIYWVGPLSASLVASLIYKHMFRRELHQQNNKTEITAELEMP